MPENGPDPGGEAVSLASALRAQAELTRDPVVAESLRRSAARMEEADARLREGLADLEQAVANARALVDERVGENALPKWVVVALVLAVVFVVILTLAVRGGP